MNDKILFSSIGVVLTALLFGVVEQHVLKQKFWDTRKELFEAVTRHETHPGWHEDLRTYQGGIQQNLDSLQSNLAKNTRQIEDLQTRVRDARSQLDTLNTSIGALLARIDDVIAKNRDDNNRNAGRGM